MYVTTSYTMMLLIPLYRGHSSIFSNQNIVQWNLYVPLSMYSFAAPPQAACVCMHVMCVRACVRVCVHDRQTVVVRIKLRCLSMQSLLKLKPTIVCSKWHYKRQLIVHSSYWILIHKHFLESLLLFQRRLDKEPIYM